MDVVLPSVSDPSFIPDLEDDCNLESANAYVSPQKLEQEMKKTMSDQFCHNTNPISTDLKNQDSINQARKSKLTRNSNLLSTAWCPIENFQDSWINFVETHLSGLIRSAGELNKLKKNNLVFMKYFCRCETQQMLVPPHRKP